MKALLGTRCCPPITVPNRQLQRLIPRNGSNSSGCFMPRQLSRKNLQWFPSRSDQCEWLSEGFHYRRQDGHSDAGRLDGLRQIQRFGLLEPGNAHLSRGPGVVGEAERGEGLSWRAALDPPGLLAIA